MDIKTFHCHFDELTKAELEKELKKSYYAHQEHRFSLEKKIHRLQEELSQIIQYMHLDKQEAKLHGIELD